MEKQKLVVKLPGWEPTEILYGDIDNAIWIHEHPHTCVTECGIYVNNLESMARITLALMLVGY